jgi:uncharacterized protein
LKIGLISDTHDDIENIRKSVEVFKERNTGIVFHAGDFVSPEAIRVFHGVKLVGVFGKNDCDKSSIIDAFTEIGGQVKGDVCEFEVDDILFAIYHGTQQDLINSLIQSAKYDVVVCGHTHRTLNSKVGKTLVLNPGTAKGWFFGYMATIAIFDTLTKEVNFIDL